MSIEPKWLRWARTIQAIGQTGLHYTNSEYDRERYQQLQELAAEIYAEHSGTDQEIIRELFAGQMGYATPKVDVRGALFRDDRILLIQERSDERWTLPGGWADVNEAPSEAVEREIREESGYRAKAERLLAVFDRSRHAHEPLFPFHVYKLFFLCQWVEGEAKLNHETMNLSFFSETDLPELSSGRTTLDQILFCFAEYKNPSGVTRFD
jgi:ADP-ribose pyrophosphatase YjhB (NUDIX family)